MAQNNDGYIETTELYSSALSLIDGVYIGARALLAIYLIWFGYIARPSQWSGGE
jgi:hypothetical protein